MPLFLAVNTHPKTNFIGMALRRYLLPAKQTIVPRVRLRSTGSEAAMLYSNDSVTESVFAGKGLASTGHPNLANVSDAPALRSIRNISESKVCYGGKQGAGVCIQLYIVNNE